VRIGSFGPTSSLKLLPALMGRFRVRYPEIEVRVDEERDNVVDQWLLDRRVDIGFVVLPDDRFDTFLMTEDEFVALLPAKHPIARKRAVTIADLKDEPFILTEAGSAPLIEPLLAASPARPAVLYRFPQIVSILGFVQQRYAVSIASRLSLPDHWPGVVYRPLSPQKPRKVGLAVCNLARLSPAARAFVDMAVESVQKIKF
jgi:DNA-binding transcriptional LysR family regulator